LLHQGFSVGDFDGGGNMDIVPRQKGEIAHSATLAKTKEVETTILAEIS